jgi:hypothetical protein
LLIVPLLDVKVPPQSIEYSPLATMIAAGASMPVIVTELDVITALVATSVWLTKLIASGVISSVDTTEAR